MKKAFVFAVALSVLSAGSAFGGEGTIEECAMPPPFAGSKELQKIKLLAGTWEGPDPMSPSGKWTTTYEVVSNGSAVLERTAIGTPYEMVSVYHDDKNGKLAMTHYCAMGNQPKMALASSSDDQIAFKFAKDNTLNPKKEDHMHSAVMNFVSPNEVQGTYTSMSKGKESKPEAYKLTRVSPEVSDAQ